MQEADLALMGRYWGRRSDKGCRRRADEADSTHVSFLVFPAHAGSAGREEESSEGSGTAILSLVSVDGNIASQLVYPYGRPVAEACAAGIATSRLYVPSRKGLT